MNEQIRELWIEAAEQEPVAKDWPLAPKTGYYNIGGKRVWLEAEAPFPETTPPQPEEPCDMKDMCIGCSPRNADGSCPDAPRKPLTDEQIGTIALESQWGFSPHDDTLRFARAIEAAHNIKE